MSTLVLDAGHGGKDPGAIGFMSLKEKDVTLSVVNAIYALLQGSGVHVLRTRSSDVFMGLDERCTFANKANADLFLSIHTNAAVSRKAIGTEFWTGRGQTESDVFATSLYEAWRVFPYPNMTVRVDKSDGDVDKESGFRVLVKTKMPAVLVEVDFISNPYMETLMAKDSWRQTRALALKTGILNYFK